MQLQRLWNVIASHCCMYTYLISLRLFRLEVPSQDSISSAPHFHNPFRKGTGFFPRYGGRAPSQVMTPRVPNCFSIKPALKINAAPVRCTAEFMFGHFSWGMLKKRRRKKLSKKPKTDGNPFIQVVWQWIARLLFWRLFKAKRRWKCSYCGQAPGKSSSFSSKDHTGSREMRNCTTILHMPILV